MHLDNYWNWSYTYVEGFGFPKLWYHYWQSIFLKMMLSWKFFVFLAILVLWMHLFQINVWYPCWYWYCSSSSDSESSSELEKQSRLYFAFNLSISCSHCCFVLVILRASGFFTCHLGRGFCCWPSICSCWWGRSASSFCALQKGQLGLQPHFSSFFNWDFVLPLCLLPLGKVLPLPFFSFCGQITF